MKWPVRLTAALLIVAGVAPLAGAQGTSRKYGELLKRIPEKANAMLLVDVDGLLDSPLGRRQKWRDRAADRPTGALGVTTDAAKLVVAAGVDLRSAEEHWKIGMLETHASPPAMTVLAAREGGYVEQLQTQSVAWTPRGFYLFSFPERVIGFAVPADRQVLSEWITTTLTRPRTFPPGWADRAIRRADAGSQVVLAVNLSQAIAPKQAEVWLKGFQSDGVKRNKMNFDLIASRLAGAKLAFLQVDVKETIQGSIRVEFESSVDSLKPIAKELILEALDDFGAEVGDLKRWDVEVKDATITLTGGLSEESVRRVLSFVTAPRLSPSYESPADATTPRPLDAGEAAQPKPPGEPTRDAALKSSQQYYRAVVDLVESLKGHKSESSRSMKLWVDRSAKQIEDLPLLNVDTELLEWGSKVALTLRETSSGINYADRDQAYRVAGTANGYYGGYGNGGSRSVDAGVIKKQSGAMLNVAVEQRWQALETTIAEVRRKMVAKYKAEF